MTWRKRAIRYVLALAILSIVMAVVQWIAAPRGGGAGDYAFALRDLGHRRTGDMLMRLHESPALSAADDFWQRILNAPRNHLLAAIGVIEQPDTIYFYGSPHRWPAQDFALAAVFALATVVTYAPLAIFAAWIVTALRTKNSP